MNRLVPEEDYTKPCSSSPSVEPPLPPTRCSVPGPEPQQTPAYHQNIKEHAGSSDEGSPPPLPPKPKTWLLTSRENPYCRPKSPKPLPSVPGEELYSTRLQFTSSQSRQTCIASSQTTNLTSVSTEETTGSQATQPKSLYQNIKEHAENTEGCISESPPLPPKPKTRLTSRENPYCRPKSPKSVTDDDYNRPCPPPPLFKPPPPPMQHSISEPVYQQVPTYLEILPAEGSQGDDGWNKWKRSVDGRRIISQWDPLQCLNPEMEIRYLAYKAEQMRTALGFFDSLMLSRGEKLRSNITELHSIADNLDKVKKRTRAMGITGGTTGAVGGAAAVLGIALAPVTMGASLIATMVGAGVVVAGTGLGAGAAISRKKNSRVDRKRLERVVQEYQADITEVERRLGVILAGMAEIRRHSGTRLPSLDREAAWVVRLVDRVYQDHAGLSSVDTFQNQVMNTGVLKGFALCLDFFFTGDDGQKVKKGLEVKFGKKIRAMAQQLQEGLDQVYKMWEMFLQFASCV